MFALIVLTVLVSSGRPGSWNHLAGLRIGEAANPGPARAHEEEPPPDFVDPRFTSDDEPPDAPHDSPDPLRSEDLQVAAESSSSDDHASALAPQQPHVTPTAHDNGGPSSASGNSFTGALIKPWDWLLSDSQLSAWKLAEKFAKCTFKQSPERPKRATTRASTSGKPELPSGEFTESKNFSGTHDGYVFRTGHLGTGYYQDAASTLLCQPDQAEDKNTTFSSSAGVCVEPAPRRATRARRARASNGRRVSGPSRSTKAMGAAAGYIIAATGLLPSRDWRAAGLFALDTANPNSLDTACDKIMSKSLADITCLQEMRAKTPDAVDAAKRRLRGLGWNSHFSLAKTTEADRASGGCAVAARRGIGVAPAGNDIIEEAYAHRIAAAHINAVVPGGFYVISVYLKDTEGLSEYNLRVLQEAAALARTLGGPWVMAGDWNMEPQSIANTSWLKVVKGTIVASQLTTCHGHTYDFFRRESLSRPCRRWRAETR